MRFLLLLFIVIPVTEMWLLIEVGARIGAFPTIGLVLLTAVVGLNLLRQQGLSTLLKANERLEQGELPANEIASGLILAVGGALLLTPGFVTDAVGFACLLPFSRQWVIKSFLKNGQMMGFTTMSSFQNGTDYGNDVAQPFQKPFEENVFEGEFHEENDENNDNQQSRLP